MPTNDSLPGYDHSYGSPRTTMDQYSSQYPDDTTLYRSRTGTAQPFPRDIYYSTSRAYREIPPDSDTKKNKDPKNVKDIFQRFSDTTSFQGIPFITAASRWYAKAIWSFIFLAAIGAWLWHSIVLIQSYIRFDTSSQVKITFDSLDFPTITLCNINPIRENTINQFGSEDLEELLELMRPEETFDSRQRRKRRKRQTVDSLEDVSRDHDFSTFNTIDWNSYANVGTFGTYLEDGYSSTTLAKLLLQEMLSEFPDYNRTQMGHRLGDMLLGCSYDGVTCSTGNFSHYLDINYGNCYSFNSKEIQDSAFTSYDSGANYGLDMILYLQNREYIKGIEQGRGMRLYVHPFGTQPFVADSGISIPTGFQTYIGMRQIQQRRLGGRYGKCGDEGEYEKYYNNLYSYTLDACLKTCTDRTIASRCNCYRGSQKQFYNQGDRQNLNPCVSQSELDCIDRTVRDYGDFTVDCNCRQECKSTDYDYLMSYDQWPDGSLWFSLVNSVCLTATEQECDDFQSLDDDADREFSLSRNFIHLKLYYRNLNIERIVEVPAYEDIQFYSDFGGAVGLWLGASIITIFELGDFFVRCIQFCCKRDVYKRRKARKRQYTTGSTVENTRDYKAKTKSATSPKERDFRAKTKSVTSQNSNRSASQHQRQLRRGGREVNGSEHTSGFDPPLAPMRNTYY